MLKIKIVYLEKTQQFMEEILIDEEARILDVIEKSTLKQTFSQVDFTALSVGVFGKKILDKANYKFRNNDRLEFYRPLRLTPNQRRLERDKQQN